MAARESLRVSIDSLHNKLWMYQTLCAVNHDFGQFDESNKWFDKGLAKGRNERRDGMHDENDLQPCEVREEVN